jgi:DNA repair protein RecO (recombination protein O)
VTLFVLGYLDDAEVWPALLVRWEMALLDELGFGLDLSSCAATGSKQDLVFVSPKSGRAVSADAGAPYKERMLSLPPFLAKGYQGTATQSDVVAGLELTAHFLETRVLIPREETMPQARRRVAELIARRAAAAAR